MKTYFLFVITTAFLIAISVGSILVSCAAGPPSNIPPTDANGRTPAKKTMQVFRSEQELAKYFRELAEKLKLERQRMVAETAAAPAQPNKSSMAGFARDMKSSTDKDESVTNVQHAGVDEGGIVKLHGNHLVVLRRGRLFTVAIDDGSLKPISAVDAFAPDIDPRSTWYDEMLVSEDTVAVIGYSYERGGTEIGLFQINDAGQLS